MVRFHAPNAGHTGLIPGQGTKMLHATRDGHNNNNNNNNNNKGAKVEIIELKNITKERKNLLDRLSIGWR